MKELFHFPFLVFIVLLTPSFKCPIVIRWKLISLTEINGWKGQLQGEAWGRLCIYLAREILLLSGKSQRRILKTYVCGNHVQVIRILWEGEGGGCIEGKAKAPRGLDIFPENIEREVYESKLSCQRTQHSDRWSTPGRARTQTTWSGVQRANHYNLDPRLSLLFLPCRRGEVEETREEKEREPGIEVVTITGQRANHSRL